MFDNFPFYGSFVSHLYDETLTRRTKLLRKGPLSGIIGVQKGAIISDLSLYNNTKGFFSTQGVANATDEFEKTLAAANIKDYYFMGSAALRAVDSSEVLKSWGAQLNPSMDYYAYSIPPVTDRFFLYFGRLQAHNG